MSRPLLDAAHIRVHRQDVTTEREVPHRRSRVRPHARQLSQISRPAFRRDLPCSAMQVQAAAVVPEPLPFANHRRRRRLRQRLDRRPAFEPLQIARHDPFHLRLLQHYLRHEDRVRIPRPPPGEVTAVLGEPSEQYTFHGGERTLDGG